MEAEKNLKELLAQQPNNGSKGGPPNQNKNLVNHDNGKGAQRGTSQHNCSRPLKCYNCQQLVYMAYECKNPTVPCSNGQQFPITPKQGLIVHAQTFAPTQYHATAP